MRLLSITVQIEAVNTNTQTQWEQTWLLAVFFANQSLARWKSSGGSFGNLSVSCVTRLPLLRSCLGLE